MRAIQPNIPAPLYGMPAGQTALYHNIKRASDAIAAVVLLVALSPLLAAIVLAIKLDSRGPVLFVHERVGSRRRRVANRWVWEIEPFQFLKFRSMIHDADPSLHQAHIQAFVSGKISTDESDSARFKLKQDPRITRVGRILRRTSLDELPQLVNVLKGNMSLVGPRPVPTYEVACYRPQDFDRFKALPGITGLWQVRGRCELSFDEMMRLDREYIDCQSLWLDFKILCLTLPAILSGRGAR